MLRIEMRMRSAFDRGEEEEEEEEQAKIFLDANQAGAGAGAGGGVGLKGRAGLGAVVVCAGEHGVLLLSRAYGPEWVPAFYDAAGRT